MKQVHLQKLMVEITRKCVMGCKHCLRDKAQNKDMSAETIKNLARQLKSVGRLSVSGGETFLVPEKFRELAEAFTQPEGPRFLSWLVITSLSTWNDDIKEALHEFNLASNIENEEPEANGSIYVSNTQWHKDARERLKISDEVEANKKALIEAAEYIGVAKLDLNYEEDLSTLYDMGGAKELDIEKIPTECTRPRFEYRELPDGDMNILGSVYIDVDGYVCPWGGASFEYDKQAKRAWGNINEEPLYDILKRVKDKIICPAASALEKLREARADGEGAAPAGLGGNLRI